MKQKKRFGSRGQVALTPPSGHGPWSLLPLFGLKFKAVLLVLLMTICGVQSTHADDVTLNFWSAVGMRYGMCDINHNTSIPYNALNNSGDCPTFFSNDEGIGYNYTGTLPAKHRQILMSIWMHKETVPSYTKRTITWAYKHTMDHSLLYHGSGIYFFDNQERVQSKWVDMTIGLDNGVGSEYRNSWHSDWGNENTHKRYDHAKTFELNNINGSGATDFYEYLLLTDGTENGHDSGKRSTSWSGFKSTSWTIIDTYYKHITFNANGGTGAMALQTIVSKGRFPTVRQQKTTLSTQMLLL